MSSHPDIHDDETSANPLDMVEKLAVANDWPFHRQTDEELAAEIAGQWCHYKLWFAWHPELEVMHLSCALDMKVPAKKRTSSMRASPWATRSSGSAISISGRRRACPYSVTPCSFARVSPPAPS